MSKITWKPSTLLSPVPPTLVTCGTLEQPKILTIAWTGIINTIPPMTYISVRPERNSHHIIERSGEFVINLATKALVRKTDFVGVRTGARMDKFKETGLTAQKASAISAPLLTQSPLSLECRVTEIKHLGSHDMFIAEIVAVDVEEEFIDEQGKLRLDKCHLLAYCHGEYYELGQKLGSFGFSVKKKKKPHSRG